MTDPTPIPLSYSGGGTPGARRPPRPRGPVRQTLAALVDAVGWAAAAFAAVVGPVFVCFWTTGLVLGYPALLATVVGLPLLTAAAQAVRRRRALAVLAYLEQAVRLNQPIDRLLAAAAAGERGRLRRRLETLCLAVQGGMSLGDAVAVTVPEMPARAVGEIAYAESTGRLPAALRRLVDDGRRRAADGTPESRAFAAWYPPLAGLLIWLVMTLLAVFVWPKFRQVFHDFRAPLPPLSRAVFGLFDVFDASDVFDAAPGLALLWPAVAVVALFLIGDRLRRAFRADRRAGWLAGRWHRVRRFVPIVGSLHRDRGLADLCDALADAVGQGFPLEVAVGRADRLGLDGALRRRTTRWAAELHRGAAPAAAARAAGLPPLVAGLVAAADPADAAAGLRFAARFYAGRHAARRAVLAAAYVPAVTLALGLVVGLVSLALILPLRDLIDRVAPYQVGL